MHSGELDVAELDEMERDNHERIERDRRADELRRCWIKIGSAWFKIRLKRDADTCVPV